MSGTAKGRSQVNPPQVDPDLAQLILEPTSEELRQLEANLRSDGRCLSKLVVWKGRNLLLDGHQRLRICQQHGIPFEVEEIELADKDAAREWIMANQLGRRNLSATAASYYRGKLYETLKAQGRRNDLTSGQNVQKSTTTAEQLGKLYGVDEKTIRRDAHFANNVDAIAKGSGLEARRFLLAHQCTLTRDEFEELAAMEPTEQEQTMQNLICGLDKHLPRSTLSRAACDGTAGFGPNTVPSAAPEGGRETASAEIIDPTRHEGSAFQDEPSAERTEEPSASSVAPRASASASIASGNVAALIANVGQAQTAMEAALAQAEAMSSGKRPTKADHKAVTAKIEAIVALAGQLRACFNSSPRPGPKQTPKLPKGTRPRASADPFGFSV
jgi:hypothetical protein